MNSAPHRIRSLRWQVGAGSTTEAFSWRMLLHEKGTDLLLPTLQQGFDEAAPGEQVLRIPRIELSVRVDTAEDLAIALSGQVLDQLRNLLQQSLPGDDAAGQTPPDKGDATGNGNFDTLLHYLQTGMLPWQAANIPALDQAAALSSACCDEWLRLLDHLKSVREEASFYFRLLQLLSKDECALLIRDISGDMLQAPKAAVMKCLALLLDDAPERFSHFTRLSLMAGILAKCVGLWKQCDPSSLLKFIAATVPPQESRLLEGFVAALTHPAVRLPNNGARPDPSGAPSPDAALPTATLALPFPDQDMGFPAPGKRRQRHGADDGLPARTDTSDQRRHPEQLMQNTPDRRRRSSPFPKPGEGVAVPSAMGRQSRPEVPVERFPLLVQQVGLILLHPYITRLFEHCGIKKAGSAGLEPIALGRAAALLHFMASGRGEPYEYELGLIKILLGLDPDRQLPVCSGLLTPDDREEAEALLSAVISHWSILKDTSIQGLRSTFIERQGLLRRDDNGWRLNVERKPYDILLDQIPWSIGVARLPWMPQAIFTEW